MRMVALVAHDQTDSMRNLDGSPSRVVCFGVWIVVGSGVCSIHIFLIHLRLVNRTLFEQMVKIMAIGTTRVDHRWWVDLVHNSRSVSYTHLTLPTKRIV